jgi:hypothetical protein
MLIPNKHSGYQTGIRLYPGGGSSGQMGTGNSGGGQFTGFGGSNISTYNPSTPAWGTTEQSKADYYNQQLGAGQNDQQIRSNVDSTLGGSQSDANWGRLVQTAGTRSPTGRPMPGSAQFFQPIYNEQYQNYNTGNPMNVSQYGQQQPQVSFSQPFNPYTGGFAGGFGGDLNNFQPGGRGGGASFNQAMGEYGLFSGMGGGGGKGSMMQPQQRGYPSQNMQSFGGNMDMPQQYSRQPMYTPPQSMTMDMPQQSMTMDIPQQGRGNLSMSTVGRGGMPQMGTGGGMPQQSMTMDTQNQFSGGMGRSNFIPNAPLPEGMVGTMGGFGFDPVTGRMDLGSAGGSGQYTPAPPRSSGPSQAIVGRSSQMRGAPNVMRRAEGGIASLMGYVE